MTPTRRLAPAADGVRLSVLEAGPTDGPLTILLHGFPEDALSWSRQIEVLAAADFRVVAPDQRGYGASDKPAGLRAYRLDRLTADILALADGLGRDRFHLVGHDWGGVVAWRLAARHPERLDRLAILNAPHPGAMSAYLLRSPMQALRSAYIGAFQLPALPERLLGAADFRMLAGVLRGSSRRSAFDDAELERLRAGWRAPGTLTAMLNWYRALRLKPWPSVADRVTTPTLILWGAHDAFLQRGLAEAAAALCDRPKLVWLEDAGHWLHHEAPETVGAALLAFLTEPAATRAASQPAIDPRGP